VFCCSLIIRLHIPFSYGFTSPEPDYCQTPATETRASLPRFVTVFALFISDNRPIGFDCPKAFDTNNDIEFLEDLEQLRRVLPCPAICFVHFLEQA
jgi:hypothetical protein